MKALSIQQPHADEILLHGKDIENRTWKLPASMKGQRIYVHAGKRPRGRYEGSKEPSRGYRRGSHYRRLCRVVGLSVVRGTVWVRPGASCGLRGAHPVSRATWDSSRWMTNGSGWRRQGIEGHSSTWVSLLPNPLTGTPRYLV